MNLDSKMDVAYSTGLKRKDTTKGPPLRILSLDGGGVRGYSMLIILQELMHRTFVETEGRAPRRHEIPKPCEHFDLIAGTGTGGLIAIMLGRLRLDIETCKDVYVRMTKRVFETDKTIAGIPYRSTLFKASKLEEAIRECVREHTVYDDEGNDADDAMSMPAPNTPTSPASANNPYGPQRSLSNASRYSTIGMTPVNLRMQALRWGNPNALLYDNRENRTKCAVTAVFKGTPMNGNAILLRSYDSRKEPAPEFNCTIWQAGRATSATALAFKPIQIGQSVFLDDGAGKYNPAPQILDEAAVNEWPGREVGVFVSIGTGKRPPGTNSQQHVWWEGFMGSGMGEFAEARRRLMNKIEGCEETHQYMMREHLTKRGVNLENYYRLNVEVGVGEFGMNEWDQLAAISTKTRMYLARNEVQRMNMDAAAKIARIHFAKVRHERLERGETLEETGWSLPNRNQNQLQVPPPSNPMAIELPAEDVMMSSAPLRQQQRPVSTMLSPFDARRPSGDFRYASAGSDEFPQVVDQDTMPRTSADYRQQLDPHGQDPRSSNGSLQPSPRRSGEGYQRPSPPPLPPKTPIQGQQRPMQGTMNRPPAGINVNPLPYPDTDGPPPVVNMARKPEYGVY